MCTRLTMTYPLVQVHASLAGGSRVSDGHAALLCCFGMVWWALVRCGLVSGRPGKALEAGALGSSARTALTLHLGRCGEVSVLLLSCRREARSFRGEETGDRAGRFEQKRVAAWILRLTGLLEVG